MGKENRLDGGLSMTECGDETPEEQRIKGTSAESVSYQKGQKYRWKEKEENS